eukprot:jgi/Tetstr1/435105/TSEL_024073.t1
MCCRACGASVSKARFYDTHRWTEARAKPPPDTAVHVAAVVMAPLRQLLHRTAVTLLRRGPAGSDTDIDAEGIVAGVVEGIPSHDSRSDKDGERRNVGARRRQLHTGADATLIKVALYLCEMLSKLRKKHMLPKDGPELTETWYQVEQCMYV